MILATYPVYGEVNWTFDNVQIRPNTEIDTTSLVLQSPEQINRDYTPDTNIEPLNLSEKEKELSKRMATHSKIVTSEEMEIPSSAISSNSVLISTATKELKPSKLEEFIDEELLSLVENLPEVLEAKSNIGLSDFEIAKVKSERGPKVKISTSGGYKFLSNLEPDHRRYSDNKGFIDTTLGLSLKIFDSGQSNEKIKAERIRQLSKTLNYENLIRQEYANLIKLVYETLEAEEASRALDVSLGKTKDIRETEKKRYLSGTGTSSNIKELDLIAIDLINEKQLLRHEIELNTTNFKNKYGEKIDRYFTIITNKSLDPIKNITQPKIEQLDSVRTFDLEISALDSDISSRKKINKPSINLNVTSNFYDSQNGIGNYEVNGGLNLDFPFFDSGFIKNDIDILLSKKTMVRNKRFSKIQKIQKEIQGIKNRLDDIKQQRQANQLKIENLKDKIRQLKLKTQGLEAKGVEIAKTDYTIDTLQRSLDSLAWIEKTIILEKAVLFEKF